MAWPPTTHQDVQDAVAVLQTGKQDTATLGADVAADATVRAAFELRTGTPTLMALGDSITANGGGAIDPVTLQVEPTYNPTSYTFWAHLLSGGRFLHAGDAATGGYTSAQIRDTHLPTVLARKPAYCVTLIGQNSQTDLDAPVDIWEALVAAGITPILCTLPATGTAAALWKFNQFVAQYAREHGLPLVDFHAATVDTTTGGYKAGYSGDGTHPTEAGAKAMGQALADVLARVIPNPAVAGVLADNNAATDLEVGNPLFLTDDGSGLATNWTGLAAFDGSFDTDPAVAGRVWTVAAPTTADSAVGASFDVTPGNRYQIAAKLSADVEAVGGVWVLRFLSVAPTVNFYTLAEFTKDVPIGSAYAIEWVCPATITTVRFDILAKTAAGASMSIGQFTVRDLTALGLA
jgi:lysophospholipase L1-like esterase